MADLRKGIKINKENHGQLHASKNINENVRKKQAFGELKNVIHNQHQSKLLKFPVVNEASCTHKSKYRGLNKVQTGQQNKLSVDHSNVVQPAQRNQLNLAQRDRELVEQTAFGNQEKIQLQAPMIKNKEFKKRLGDEERIELLKYFDIERSCCAKPYKSDRQIWSETDMFDDSLIDKIMRRSTYDKEEDPEGVEVYRHDESDSEDLLNLNNSTLFAPSTLIDETDDFMQFMTLPPALDISNELPNFEDFRLGI